MNTLILKATLDINEFGADRLNKLSPLRVDLNDYASSNSP
jgi:hypothetical protein